jgi:hypothetical protein
MVELLITIVFPSPIITLENGIHVQKEVSHLFPYYTQRQVDIVIIKDDFQTPVNSIIVDLTCTNLMQCASITIAHATIVAIQDKTRS